MSVFLLMRYLIRLSFLIIIMTLTSAAASADKYSRAWKKVDELIEKDLPESAAKETSRIWDMAAKDGDSRQLLKSAVYMTQVETTFGENNVEKGIDLFTSLLPKLKVREHQAICHAFIAKGYLHYSLGRNPYGSARALCDSILYHLDQSIQLAGDVASGYYEEFFPGSNKDGLKLRPTLADMLMDDATILVTQARLPLGKRGILQDRRLYGSAMEYLEATIGLDGTDPDLWPLYVLKLLTAHNNDTKPIIRCTVDLRRMNILRDMLDANGDWTKADDDWLRGCVALGQSYQKKVKFSTMFYELAARCILNHDYSFTGEQKKDYYALAHTLCELAQKEWPKSEGAFGCIALQERIERKDIQIMSSIDLLPGRANVAGLSFANVSEIYMKIVEVPGRSGTTDEISLLAELNRAQSVSEWKVKVYDPGDFMTHYALANIPPVMEGCYYLMASSGPYFNSGDVISYKYMECSSISFIMAVADNGMISGTAVNMLTGRPVPDCKYTVWNMDWQGHQVKVATRGMADSEGFFTVEGLKNGRYSIELEHAGKKGNCEVYVPWVSDMPDRVQGRFYTDRSVYLPGDSVSFAFIAYHCDGYEKGRVAAGNHVKITFEDPKNNELAVFSLVTDSMGIVKGTVHVPDNALPGTYLASCVISKDADEVADRTYHRGSFKVESFQQPKFGIKVDENFETKTVGQPVRITGKAVSLTDVPISGAVCRWKAEIDSYNLYRLLDFDDTGCYCVDSGEGKTGADGSFSLTFTVPSDILMSEDVWVNVTVSVTDVNGETHDALSQIRFAGKPSLYFENDGAVFHIFNDGQAGDVKVKIWRVQWPQKPLFPLPFETANLDSISKDELMKYADGLSFQTRFPQYEFDLKKKMEPVGLAYDGTLHSDGGKPMILELPACESGYYRVELSADGYDDVCRDVLIVRPDDRSFVPDGKDDFLWGRVPGCTGYEAAQVSLGETAQISLSCVQAGAVVHYFVENRFGICSHGMLETDGSQQLLEIPVTDELKGAFTVHMGVMYEGRSYNRSFRFEAVDNSRKLKVELSTVRHIMEPDSPEEWTVTVTDNDGNPVSAALMLDMYDSALDNYGINGFDLNPWNDRYIGEKDIAQSQIRYPDLYAPYDHVFGMREYKGKRAMTGRLKNPFEYQMPARKTKAAVPNLIMAESDELAVADYDMDLQGRVGGFGLNGQEIKSDEIPYNLRTDMNPTGLFVAGLMTDSTGQAKVTFKAPQLLTRWILKGIAYTDSLKVGSIRDTLTTRKELMVEPLAPRFLRQGDVLDFTQKVSNLTDKDVSASVSLVLKDAISDKTLKIVEGAQKKDVTVPAGGSARVSFRLRVPRDLNALTYTTVAKTQTHTDAIQQTLPVLGTRMQVVQSLSLFNNGNETRRFDFKELAAGKSDTMGDEQLTLEYSASPIWYAVQALPSMVRTNDISNIGLVYSLMGGAMTQEIVSRNPAIHDMLDEWKDIEPDEWQKRVELNAFLTGTLADETPWVLDRRDDRLRRLAETLDSANVDYLTQSALSKLKDAQLSDGSWPWISGGPSSLYVTDLILQCLGLLRENTGFEPGNFNRAVQYLDAEFYKRYDVRDRPETLGYSELNYLMTRSYFQSTPFKDDTRASYNYFLKLAMQQDTHELGLYFRAQLALLYARLGKNDQAGHVVETLLERSLYDDEMGRWWRDNTGGYLWHEAPVETQSLIIRALLAVGKSDEADEAARWLLKQKQTTDWGSSPATAAAVVALMAAGGNRQLEQTPDISITVGSNSVVASDSKATGGYVIETWKPVTKDMARVTVDSRSDGISWGAVYRSFTEEMDKVEPGQTGMTLKRTMWIAKPDGDELVQKRTVLRAGDRVKVRFELTTDRAMEFLQLIDMRPATFEPVSTRAGYLYNWADDIAYYVAPGGTRNVFYIDRLGKGSYIIEYEVTVQKPGQFMAAPAVMQCLYAPQFRATTESSTITVQ